MKYNLHEWFKTCVNTAKKPQIESILSILVFFLSHYVIMTDDTEYRMDQNSERQRWLLLYVRIL